MKSRINDVTVAFNENGNSLAAILEEIFKIVINTPMEDEEKCREKQ